MNAKMIKQIQDDYREILSSDAGKRVIGGIFHLCKLQVVTRMDEHYQGRRNVALQIANIIYEINPYSVIDCMKAYEDLMKEYPDDERRNDAEPYEFD